MVFYRKYRSQTIDELDNAEVREKLTALLTKSISSSVPHAFLFTGPKGLGKTSTARILAKAVNCETNTFASIKNQDLKSKKIKQTTANSQNPEKDVIEPCNQCEQCLSITNGTNLDVIEIDAASNRGIDDIRDLKEKINLSPLQSRKKVYIIDEVHMLTTEAFNALLKTLEEPPAHVLFILCTTELHKVPSTIVSRCFHLSFHSATTEELMRSFKRIVAGEKLQISDDALQLIAQMADGGFRDGTKLLEEVVALSPQGEIIKSFVEQALRVTNVSSYVETLLQYLNTKDITAALQLCEQLAKEKIDSMFFLQQLLQELHKLFLTSYSLTKDKPTYDQLHIYDAIEAFTYAFENSRKFPIPYLAVEVAIVDYCSQTDGVATKPASTAETKPVEVATEISVQSVTNTVTVSHLRKQVGAMAKVKALYGEKAVDQPTEEKKVTEVVDVSLLQFSRDGEITPEWLLAFWKSLINEMKKYNHTVAGVLRGCKIRTFDRKDLVIETAFKFHKEKLDEIKTKSQLEDVCKALMGNPVVVRIELVSNK